MSTLLCRLPIISEGHWDTMVVTSRAYNDLTSQKPGANQVLKY